MKRSPMPARREPMPRTAMKPRQPGPPERNEPRRRRTALRTVSPKRRRENRQRAAMAKAMGPEPVLCACRVLRAEQLGLPPLEHCTVRAEHWHEKLSRGRGGSITDRANILPLCDYCNDHLEDRPDSELGWAYEIGLKQRSGRGAAGRAA